MWTTNLTKQSTRQSDKGIYGQAYHAFQKLQNSQKKRNVLWLIAHTLLMFLAVTAILSLFSRPAHADINPIQAQRALIGEAANQGLTGMTACAEVNAQAWELKGLIWPQAGILHFGATEVGA